MKTTNLLISALFFGILILGTSCGFGDDDGGLFNCVQGDGDLVTETFVFDDFTGIELDISADVFITQGETFEVVVEGEQNIIDELDMQEKSEVLEICFDRCVRDFDDLKIFLTMPVIESLFIKGSGDIVSQNLLEVDDIDLRIKGSGDMDLALNADNIDTKISGSGEIILEGNASDHDMEISGSGDMKAFDLETEKVDIKISGSGDAEVFAVDKLKVKITGSGDVFFIGNPSLDIEVTGSGEIRDKN